jgi:GntR family transcriptional regulator/MocR family aminotransferase
MRDDRIALIEDDYDHEFHYDGRRCFRLPARTMRGSSCTSAHSRRFAPGFRIGYIVAPPAVLRSATAIRSLLDIQGDQARRRPWRH